MGGALVKPPAIGDRVQFVDANATVSDGKPVTREGVVNGEPFGYVPVFAERDNGREATTIFVAPANIRAIYRRETHGAS